MSLVLTNPPPRDQRRLNFSFRGSTSYEGQLALARKRGIKPTSISLTRAEVIYPQYLVKRLFRICKRAPLKKMSFFGIYFKPHLHSIFKYAAQMHQLKELTFRVTKIGHVPNPNIDFMKRIRRFDRLEKFSLIAPDCAIQDDHFLQNLQVLLQKAPSLKDFEIDIGPLDSIVVRGHTLTNVGIRSISKRLRNLIHLKRSRLNIGEADITDRAFGFLKTGFKRLSKLSEFSLNLHRELEVSNEVLFELGSLLGALSNIKKLSLSLRKCKKLTDKALFNLHCMSDFSNLANLEELEIDIAECDQITDSGTKSILELINKIQNPKSISLNYHQLTITNNTLFELVKTLESFSSLRTFSLNCALCMLINDDALNCLKTTLPTLANIENLCLDFRGCSMVSDRGIECLCQAVGSLENLKCLSLNFSWSDRVSNLSLQYLKEALNKKPLLTSLHLDFHSLRHNPKGCMVTDKGIQSLYQAIEKLQTLKSLSLNLENCPITDLSLLQFEKALAPLTNLEEFYLNISKCLLVSNKGLMCLQKAFVKLPKLLYIKLNVAESKHIQSIGISNITQAITAPRILRIIR